MSSQTLPPPPEKGGILVRSSLSLSSYIYIWIHEMEGCLIYVRAAGMWSSGSGLLGGSSGIS